MKIAEILIERNLQKVTTTYHGTSSKFLRSILKQGLLAQPPKRVYDEGSWKTMGGVYLTGDIGIAMDAASTATDEYDGDPILITLNYVQNSGFIDEDYITFRISLAISSAHKTQSDPEDTIYNYLIKDRKLKINTGNYDKIRQFAKQFGDVIKSTKKWNSTYHLDTNQDLRNKLQVILKLIKPVDLTSTNTSEVWLDKDITFSGKTRIVKIENLNGDIIYPKKSSMRNFTVFYLTNGKTKVIKHGDEYDNQKNKIAKYIDDMTMVKPMNSKTYEILSQSDYIDIDDYAIVDRKISYIGKDK